MRKRGGEQRQNPHKSVVVRRLSVVVRRLSSVVCLRIQFLLLSGARYDDACGELARARVRARARSLARRSAQPFSAQSSLRIPIRLAMYQDDEGERCVFDCVAPVSSRIAGGRSVLGDGSDRLRGLRRWPVLLARAGRVAVVLQRAEHARQVHALRGVDRRPDRR